MNSGTLPPGGGGQGEGERVANLLRLSAPGLDAHETRSLAETPQSPSPLPPSLRGRGNSRALAVLGCLALGPLGRAQIPDISVKLDLAGTYRDNGVHKTVRLYDPFGRFSLLTFKGTLEPGFKFTVAQKLQRAARDGEPDGFEEYYLEDEGIWKLGKQYLPFGLNHLYREAALAARGDANLFFDGVPFQVALVDSGKGRQSGLIGRAGAEFGVSAAFGRHFGINGTAFALVSELERGAGRGHGYKQILGADYSQKAGTGTAGIEYVNLGRPERSVDRGNELWDVFYRYEPSPDLNLTVGFSLAMRDSVEIMRFQGKVAAHRNLVLEPYVRTRNGKIWDGGITFRVRL